MGVKNRSGIRRFLGPALDTKVFWGAAALSIPFLILGGFFPKLLGKICNAALAYLTSSWSWLYLYSVSGFVFICLVLALSPLGKIRLGREDEKPEFSRWSWFAMLFSAGMGIGLVFFSVAEPMYHFMSPPTGQGNTPAAARLALEIFFYHWGIHAWGTYVVVGLALAYFCFRKGEPAIISRCLIPMFGPRVMDGVTGKMVDILAIWATVMGVVTSLGLGALQITSGLSHSTGLPGGLTTTALVIAIITVAFIVSALSGVKRGIRYLSLLNIWLMIVVLLFFLVTGPTRFLVLSFCRGLVDYLRELVPLSVSVELFNNPEWTKSWTVFYWAWWIAWAPFVGAFIARISRGRTIREFVLGVMILPSLFSFMFATALGGTAVHIDLFQSGAIGELVKKSAEVALFETLRYLPLYGVLAALANLLIASFFITSADSATYVISRFSTAGRGEYDQSGHRRLIVFWGSVLGGLAIVLIYSGGLKALQTASIVGAFPFMFVMYLLLVSIIKDLLQSRKG